MVQRNVRCALVVIHSGMNFSDVYVVCTATVNMRYCPLFTILVLVLHCFFFVFFFSINLATKNNFTAYFDQDCSEHHLLIPGSQGAVLITSFN